MGNDNFVKVFDIVDSGFKNWAFSAFGLIFVVVGVIIFFFPKIIDATGIPNLNFKSRLQTFFRYGFLGFAILWTAGSFFATYSGHLRHKAIVQQNRCRVVEGPVEHFVPGRAQESFSVAGVPFRYSDFMITDGFNNTSSHGGPIRSDSYVRICYDPPRNVILRLEIRDFKGELKDYAKAPSIFPAPGPSDISNVNGNRPTIDPPWYSSLFVVLYILELLGIHALFVPYLRTFFRLKTVTLQGCSIPKSLTRGKKIKLRNSMIYWDVGSRAIWLRPRGFNFIKVPLMVGKLNIDANAKSIAGAEICFSSGIPFVWALFFWTAYCFFSAAMPSTTSGFSPALFVGVAALMFLIVTPIKLRTLRSRMEQLIHDAVSEIEQM
jgi:hypothetical protein